MSRIYEAIQRADRDRHLTQESQVKLGMEAASEPCIVELPAIQTDLDLENIAYHPWKPYEASLPTLAARGASVEQFRGLRSRIDQLRIQAPIKTILVSSGMPSEGKTFIAANLAVSMARGSANRILLIDGDLRRGTLHTLLGAPNEPGLTEYLSGTADLTNIMQRNVKPTGGAMHGISNVTFISAGLCSENSSEIVVSRRMEELIAILAPQFDWIVIDSPPVLAVSDAIELARAADAVLLVARAATTPFDVAQRTLAAFANSRVLGFVLNAASEVPRNQSYSYYYGKDDGQRP